jgi:1-acyl-sn-glycerol-3-phosphate acyltransferase
MILSRALLFNIGFYLWTLVLGILALPVLLGPRRWAVALSRLWTGGALVWLRWSVGLDYEVRGRENLPTGPAIVALKHQSAWETLMLNQLLRDPTIVLKRELLWIPIFGWYLRACRMIIIDRKAGAAALRQMIAQGRAALADGRLIAIFPEGTRGPIGAALPYQPGVGALYGQLGVPLVPVALNSGLFWGRNAFMKRPGRIVVDVLPAIPAGMDRRRALVLLEQRIEAATARLLATASPVDKSVGKSAGAS